MSEDLGRAIMLAKEFEERLNRATAVALHYHPCGDENKSPDDHITEVLAALRHDRKIIGNTRYYTAASELSELLKRTT